MPQHRTVVLRQFFGSKYCYHFVTFFTFPSVKSHLEILQKVVQVGVIIRKKPHMLDKSGTNVYTKSSFPSGNKSYNPVSRPLAAPAENYFSGGTKRENNAPAEKFA